MIDFKNILEISISVITALLGLAYPMFVEKVDGIERLYKSRQMSDKFKREFSYWIFNKLLVLCIFELFVFPFIIMNQRSISLEMILLTVQTISVLILAMNMTQIYILLIVYNAPEKLSQRIIISPRSELRLSELTTMAIFASHDPLYSDVYEKCMNEIRSSIYNFQQNELRNNSESKENGE